MAKRISAIFFLTVIFSAFAVLCVRFSAGGADGLTLTLRALVDGEVSAQLIFDDHGQKLARSFCYNFSINADYCKQNSCLTFRRFQSKIIQYNFT